MKKTKALKITFILLIIILISLISFGGIFRINKGQVENAIPDYLLGMDLKGERTLELKVSDKKEQITDETTKETKEGDPLNSQESLTLDNYKISKKIIEKRLASAGVTDDIVSLDEQTGDIYLKLSEDTKTDTVIGYLSQQGKFEVIDDDNKEVLLDNSDLESAKTGYNTATTGTTVYLTLQLKKDSYKKLENISNTYVSAKDSEGNETIKKISIQIDGTSLLTTYFRDTISNGTIQLSIGKASSVTSEIQSYLVQASGISLLLESGKMPIVYEIEQNKYIASEITTQNYQVLIIITSITVLIAIIYLIARYRTMGLLSGISFIGFIALNILLVRLTNVYISISGMFAFCLVSVICYIFIVNILNKLYKSNNKKENFKNEYLKFIKVLIPVAILSIGFCFTTYMPIISFGMIMFWGLTTTIIYIPTVTRTLIID